MIHAWTIGHMPDTIEHEAESWEYTDCPICGEPMRKASEMCADCWNEQRRTAWAETNVPDMLDRHHRIERALASSGWTLGELLKLSKKGKLPTDDEINARMRANTKQSDA